MTVYASMVSERKLILGMFEKTSPPSNQGRDKKQIQKETGI
jgi:hypothetical protein